MESGRLAIDWKVFLCCFQSKEPKTPTRASYSSKSDQSGVSLHSAEVEKFKRELRESNSREKDLKKQIESLTKTIAELTEQIENKEKVIHDLQLQFDRQVSSLLLSRFLRRWCTKVVIIFYFPLYTLGSGKFKLDFKQYNWIISILSIFWALNTWY